MLNDWMQQCGLERCDLAVHIFPRIAGWNSHAQEVILIVLTGKRLTDHSQIYEWNQYLPVVHKTSQANLLAGTAMHRAQNNLGRQQSPRCEDKPIHGELFF